MPVFMVDGRTYRVPLSSLWGGSEVTCDQWPEHDQKSTRTTPKAISLHSNSLSRTVTNTSGTGSTHVNQEPETRYFQAGVPAWSSREDKLLRELRAYRIPWNRIAIALDRPVWEVKERWINMSISKPKQIRTKVPGTSASRSNAEADVTKGERKPERHVSFSDPLVTADIDDEKETPHKIKKVFYIDKDFTLEDVVLLDKISAKWERDRWLAISTRFNDKTGRNITPEQAKSVIDN